MWGDPGLWWFGSSALPEFAEADLALEHQQREGWSVSLGR